MGKISSSAKRLIELDRELKQQAPSFVRQMIVDRCESSPDYRVSFEILLGRRLSHMEVVARGPRLAAAEFWERFNATMRQLFTEDGNERLGGSRDRAGDDEGAGVGGGVPGVPEADG